MKQSNPVLSDYNYKLFIVDKLNYHIPLMSPESVLSANGDNVSSPYQQGSLKRPRTEDYSDVGIYQTNKPSNYICTDARSFSRCKKSFEVSLTYFVQKFF